MANPCDKCECCIQAIGVPCNRNEDCCQCLEQKCPCGTAQYTFGLRNSACDTGPCKRSENFIDRKGCAACNCQCGSYWSRASNQYECSTCPPPPPPPSGGGHCFPSAARVSLENGQTVIMSELQAGDKVKTGNFHFNSKTIQSNVVFHNT